MKQTKVTKVSNLCDDCGYFDGVVDLETPFKSRDSNWTPLDGLQMEKNLNNS